ncbi:putative FYVE zinc finger, Zinc finger, FYVE/PHD-type, Zinc finger, RING/FYVE/PHD-type [Plasmopara halstedii]
MSLSATHSDNAGMLMRLERQEAIDCASDSNQLHHQRNHTNPRTTKPSSIPLQPSESQKAQKQSRLSQQRHELKPTQHPQRRRQSHEPHVSTQNLLQAPQRHSQHQPRPSRVSFKHTVVVHRPSTSQSALRTRGQSDQAPGSRTRNFRPSPGPLLPVNSRSDQSEQRRHMQDLSDNQAMVQATSVRINRANSSPEQPFRSHNSNLPRSNTETYAELSRARRREIISRVNESVQTVMGSMLSDKSKSVQWKPKLRKKDISYFTDEMTVKAGQTRFCCVSHSHASVEDIMELFVVSEEESMRRNIRVLSDTLLEARIVSILRRPTKERPMNSIYIRHACHQTPGLLMNRKVCLIVATDIIHQPDGSVIGYCLWDSIDDPEFVETTNKSNLQSCTMFRSGFFLRRSGRTSSSQNDQILTKIVYMVGLEPGGWAPGFTARLLMEKFGDNLLRLCSHFRRKRLDSRTFVKKTQWVSKLSAKSCRNCKKSFQVLSTRVNCHSCGHVVCRSCATKESVELHAVGLVPMHICFLCLKKAGLPIPPLVQKSLSTLRRRRLQSDTATISRDIARVQIEPPHIHHCNSAVESDFIKDEDGDDDDTDTGEWAFTSSGMPFRSN